eukprot:2877844-Pyramimonas_sp.AAC.1
MRVRAAPRPEPHVGNNLAHAREALATVEDECARRSGESHMFKTTRHASVELLQLQAFRVTGREE